MDREIGDRFENFGPAHLVRVAQGMKMDVTPYPSNISGFGSGAPMAESQGDAYAVEQFGSPITMATLIVFHQEVSTGNSVAGR